jgi:hemerythrin-like domain-containing protein
MDAVRMLVHDHDVLTSHVEHVSALMYGLVGRKFSPESLHDELVQQLELLKDQLLEHFGFEEEAAFPYLAEKLPQHREGVRSLSVAHDRIARALTEAYDLLRLTNRDTLALQVGPIAEAFERFVNGYRNHVREESDILSAMEAELTISQRGELSEIARGLI